MLILVVFLSLVFTDTPQNLEVRDEFTKLFDEAGVSGSFSLYNASTDTYILVNQEQFRVPYTPASTFKICNSLIGLESGVITDEHFIIKWDGVERRFKKWNADQDLKTAYKNSSVPYYQELARRVGAERMSALLNKSGYGNTDTSGGIDLFWLTGGLRVTPEQQIDFLRKLHTGKLPFAKRSMQIVEKIMIEEETPRYTVRSKTGLGEQDGMSIGWYIGYITKGKEVYYFATCIQNATPDENFSSARKMITRDILARLNVIPGSSKEK